MSSDNYLTERYKTNQALNNKKIEAIALKRLMVNPPKRGLVYNTNDKREILSNKIHSIDSYLDTILRKEIQYINHHPETPIYDKEIAPIEDSINDNIFYKKIELFDSIYPNFFKTWSKKTFPHGVQHNNFPTFFNVNKKRFLNGLQGTEAQYTQDNRIHELKKKSIIELLNENQKKINNIETNLRKKEVGRFYNPLYNFSRNKKNNVSRNKQWNFNIKNRNKRK